MAKVLNVNDLLQVSQQVLSEDKHDRFVSMYEALTTILAEDIARELKIHFDTATYQPGFGGLCAEFHSRTKRQKCPTVIDEADPTGDWD